MMTEDPNASISQGTLYTLVRMAPVAILTLAGLISVARGVLGSFELKPAVFGASLLVAAGLLEVLVWFMRRRSAEREVQRAYAVRWQALQKCDEVLRLLQTPQNRSIIEVIRLLQDQKKEMVTNQETEVVK